MFCKLAGLKHRPKKVQELVATFEVDREFTLEPEPPWAVRVIDKITLTFIGYIPATVSRKVSEALKGRQFIFAQLEKTDPFTLFVNVDE